MYKDNELEPGQRISPVQDTSFPTCVAMSTGVLVDVHVLSNLLAYASQSARDPKAVMQKLAIDKSFFIF